MSTFHNVQRHFDVLDRVEPVLDDIKLQHTIEKKTLLKAIDQLTQSEYRLVAKMALSVHTDCWELVYRHCVYAAESTYEDSRLWYVKTCPWWDD